MTAEQVRQDLAVLRPFWEELAKHPPKDVVGLWFGIVELVVDEQTKTTQLSMYVAGCPSMDAKDETAEWATEYCWWPTDPHEDRYVVLPELAAMGAAATRLDDWIAATEHAAAVVRALEPQNNVPTVSGVAVGFDDGDAIVTWSR